jgi:type II secretory pathway component PulF
MSTLTFEYRAVDKAGARRKGVLPASTEAEAFRKVSAMGLTPIGLKATSGAAGSARGSKRGRARITGKDLAHFTYQLGVLVSSRIPLSEGLRSIADQEREGHLKRVVTDVARRIESGEQVAQAMGAHQGAFGEIYIETVRAAERSGNLPKSLEHLSEALERGQEMTRQVRGAMMYPLCVSGVLALAMTFLVGFVVPRFARMFEQRNIELPAFTRGLMAFGNSIQGYWWAYVVAIGLAAFAVRRAWRNPRGRLAIDSLLGRVPYLGDILRGLALARFSRVLGLSVSSGLGLIESLELAGRSSGRPLMTKDAEMMAAQVRSGGRLSDALPNCDQITGFTRRMLSAGEQSAELPRMCSIISRHYERETSHLVKNIATVIEPVMIVAIAGMVLVVALAIFLPMWDMVKLVG